MKNRKNAAALPPVKFNLGNGVSYSVVPPRYVEDVDNQANIPAWILALLAFAPIRNSALCVSRFTVRVLRQIENDCGSAVLRDQLRQLLIDMENGYSPSNCYGLLISRCRKTVSDAEYIPVGG